MKRIGAKFLDLKAKQKCAFVAYICAGDPNYETSLEILKNLPQSGVDLIEIGVPFLDPSGDGPIIESAAKRAIQGGMTLQKTLLMIEEFRKIDQKTPIILMSYYNPIFKYDVDKIFVDAEKSGVDGILIVDLPIEENIEIYDELTKTNIDLIQLIAPTTNENRAKKIIQKASGFLYLISLIGTTGTKLASASDNKKNLERIRKNSTLPIVAGFGIKTKNQIEEFAEIGADGVVVGSSIVEEIERSCLTNKTRDKIVLATLSKVEEFSSALQKH
jgi:tryptophan synthase alpha chain